MLLCQGHVWEGAPPEEVALSEPEVRRTWPFLGPAPLCSWALFSQQFARFLFLPSGGLGLSYPLSLFSQAFPPHSWTLQGRGGAIPSLGSGLPCPTAQVDLAQLSKVSGQFPRLPSTGIQTPSFVSTWARPSLMPLPQGLATAPLSLASGGLSTFH